MRQPDEFDAFYRDSRDRLLLETYALTGDLPVARTAVRDAFAVAWHHWGKVSRLDDPETWVRPLAFRRAQRRHTARIWHREKDLDAEARETLEALSTLTLTQRKAFVLTNLSPLPLADIARELGVPQGEVERELQTATAQFSIARDTASTGARAHLDHLRSVTGTAQWPRASIVRRAGAARRRAHTATGVVATAAVLLAGGTLVTRGDPALASLDDQQFDAPTASPSQAAAPPKPTLSDDVLLAAAQLRPINPRTEWVEGPTSDGADGAVLPCQSEPSADPQAQGMFLRTFDGTTPAAQEGGDPKGKGRAKGRQRQLPPAKATAWQLVELSRSERAARRAYAALGDWYAGCLAERTQLLSAHRVDHVGDEARLFTLRTWKGTPRTLRVGIARTGLLTLATVTRVDGLETDVRKPTAVLAEAVNNVCSAPGANACAGIPEVERTAVPRAGVVPGMLSEFDLPPIARAPGPWIGTEPVKAKVNVASTRCDRTSFTGGGVRSNLTRTFLFPAVKKANEFGLTETVGMFPEKRAREFVQGVRDRVGRCAEDAFGTEVESLRTSSSGRSDVGVWNITMEISDKDSVQFLMAIIRSGGTVAQVGFVPSQTMSMERADFLALVDRALERLPRLELGGRGGRGGR